MFVVISLVEELLSARRDGLVAVGAVVTEELHIVRLAIGKAVILEIVGLGEDFVANVAAEVVGVPHLTERSDRTALARLTATSALLEQENFVVRRAIEVAFEVVAIATFELDTTFLAAEVTRMHELTLDEEVGANNGTAAHGTLVSIRADNASLSFHTLGAIDMLRLRLDLVLLPDEVGTATDANEVL